MLSKNNKDNPFKLPKDYFETLEERVMDRIDQTQTKKPQRIRLKQSLVWASTIAALVLLVVLVVPKVKEMNVSAPKTEMYGNMTIESEDEYYRFLEEELTTVSFEDAYYGELNQ